MTKPINDRVCKSCGTGYNGPMSDDCPSCGSKAWYAGDGYKVDRWGGNPGGRNPKNPNFHDRRGEER